MTKTEHHLCEMLEWAKGNRGSRKGNPYMIAEVKAALKHLARERGFSDPDLNYFDVVTKTEKPTRHAFPRFQNPTKANVHMNGSPACAPRPYGQLPGNTG